MRLKALAAAVAACVAIGGSTSYAANTLRDSGPHQRPQHFDVVGSFGWFGYTHFGLGGWYAFPVVPDGFIPALNEAFFVEVGGAFERYSWSSVCSYAWSRITPMGGVRWDWYLTDEWTVFAKAKAGYGIGFGESFSCVGSTISQGAVAYSGVAYDGGVGAYWHLSDEWAMRFDLGYRASVGAGMKL